MAFGQFSSPPLWMSEFIDAVNAGEDEMRRKYLAHIVNVKSLVPEEDLLIWNVKDGWEPLCKFLGHETPNLPIPHENKTGDMAFNAKYTYESKFVKVGLKLKFYDNTNLEKNLLYY